ncbi:PAS domain-containing protein [Sulfurimonas sp.]|uniref:PAS domain-containing protein n=1 Tax=Sulfurimonas sp. TaxID=2022749 RepID=UPI003567F94E
MEKHLDDDDFIVSKTDLKGRITYGNDKFIEMSGYSEKELLGAPHNILRHEDMPRIVFKLLWDRVQSSEEIFAYVKNRCKNDDHYWVFTNVTASVDKNGNIIGYYSVRRKPNPDAIETIIPIYKELLGIEKVSGVEASLDELQSVLDKNKVTYDEFIASIQK